MPLGDSTAHAALELARESAVHTARRGARPGRPRPAAHAARELALELGPAAVHTARELARELGPAAVHTARELARELGPAAVHTARELARELGPAAVHTARELARELARLGCSGLPLVGTFFTVNRT